MNKDKIDGSAFSWIVKSKLILSCLLIMMSLVLNGCSAVTRSISREIAKSNELSMTQTATARDELVITGDTFSNGWAITPSEDIQKRMLEQEKLIEAFRIAKEKNRIAMEKKLADCRVAQSQNTRVEPTATPERRVSRDPYELLRQAWNSSNASQDTRVEPVATPDFNDPAFLEAMEAISRLRIGGLKKPYTAHQSLLNPPEQESTEKSIYTQIPRYDQQLVFTICGVFWEKKYNPK